MPETRSVRWMDLNTFLWHITMDRRLQNPNIIETAKTQNLNMTELIIHKPLFWNKILPF